MVNRFSENIPVAQALAPQAITSGTVTTTTWYPATTAARHVFVLSIGANASTTFPITVLQALDASGTSSKVVSTATVSGAIAGTVAGAQANKEVIVEVLSDHLDSDNGFVYLALQFTPTGGAATAGVSYIPFMLKELPVGGKYGVSYPEILTVLYQDNF